MACSGSNRIGVSGVGSGGKMRSMLDLLLENILPSGFQFHGLVERPSK